MRSVTSCIITGILILRKLKNNIPHAHDSKIFQYIICIREAAYNSVIHSWSVDGSLCCSNRDSQPCKEFPLGNVVHASRPTGYRYTNSHAIMSGKQNTYPLGNTAGVVCNRNRQEYVLHMNNQYTAV